jgi:hypothetical protein
MPLTGVGAIGMEQAGKRSYQILTARRPGVPPVDMSDTGRVPLSSNPAERFYGKTQKATQAPPPWTFDTGRFPVSTNPAERSNGRINEYIASESLGGIQGGLWDMQAKGKRRSRRLRALYRVQTPGAKVVDSIQSVRDQFMRIQHNVMQLVKKRNDLSMADLMGLQYEVMQLAYLNELSSKVSDKLSQGIQTLFRNQG